MAGFYPSPDPGNELVMQPDPGKNNSGVFMCVEIKILRILN